MIPSSTPWWRGSSASSGGKLKADTGSVLLAEMATLTDVIDTTGRFSKSKVM